MLKRKEEEEEEEETSTETVRTVRLLGTGSLAERLPRH